MAGYLPNNSTYGGFQSSGTQAPSQIPPGYGQQQMVPYDPNASTYNQAYPALRQTGNFATINTQGQGDLAGRVNSLTNSYYAQAQAQNNAMRMVAGNNIAQGAQWLSGYKTDPNTAKSIFQSAYNEGLVPSTGVQQPWHVGMTTQDNSNSLENQFAAQNRGIYGAANQGALNYLGINPNAVSQAYQTFLNRNT